MKKKNNFDQNLITSQWPPRTLGRRYSEQPISYFLAEFCQSPVKLYTNTLFYVYLFPSNNINMLLTFLFCRMSYGNKQTKVLIGRNYFCGGYEKAAKADHPEAYVQKMA